MISYPVQGADRLYGGSVSQRTHFSGNLLDASGRLRTSQPRTIFSSKQFYGLDTGQLYASTNGAGASVSHLSAESAARLRVGTVSGEYAIFQSLRYLVYQPGKSQLVLITGVLGTGATNCTRRIGAFDDSDGLFFELAGTTLSVVRRTSTSGVAVDNVVNQSAWNLDRLDGSGLPWNPSGETLDTTKAQVFVIDYQWLGGDKVRFGFALGERIIYCHAIYSANDLDAVYMARADLPVRSEIRNTGVTSGSNDLKHICVAVASEAGYDMPGTEFSAGNGITLRAVTTRIPILAIRPKGTFRGKTNRRTHRIIAQRAAVKTNDAYIELVHMHAPSGITATWADVSTESSVEYSTDISAITGNPEHPMDAGYVLAGQAGKGTIGESSVTELSVHNVMVQNFDATNPTLFLVYATSLSGTANVGATMTWIEYD